MADEFSEITQQSWFGRIGDSIKGVLVGLILLAIGCVLLFWNEGRAIKTAKGLVEGAKAVITVKTDAIGPENDGKLIHFTATAQTTQHLEDPEFAIFPQEYILKLNRNVQMYQWAEKIDTKTTKNVGGSETTEKKYTYSKGWSDKLIESSSFKYPADHQNPQRMPFESKTLVADPIKAGAFTLSADLTAKIATYQPLPVTTQPDLALAGPERASANTPTPTATSPARFKVVDNGYYVGANPATPQIGDAKVTFTIIKPGPVSVIAKQVSGQLAPYLTKTGTTILDLRPGTLAAADMFTQLQNENSLLTWILRAVGFILIWIGLMSILKPLVVVADVIPLLGDLLGMGLGIATGIAAASLSILVISIGWIIYRPVLGIALLAAAIAAMVMLKSAGKSRRQSPHPAANV